ncbi:MAG: diaminopimelate epimerase [Nitrospiria bacterium]
MKTQPIPFWKLSGCGNDFIIIDYRRPMPSQDEMRLFVSKVCRRGLSVGADGVILIKPSTVADYGWHYYNADGGEVDMCANGTRCAARFAYENNIASAKHCFETKAGIVNAEVLQENGVKVRVQLPDPSPVHLGMEIELGDQTLEGHFVNTGVEHVVYFVEDLEKTDVIGIGRKTRYHHLFAPGGTNANFACVTDPHKMIIRTYERGVENETLACGTGCIAAALVATARQKISPPVSLLTRGGMTLEVDFKQDGSSFKEVCLTGDARVIYKGEIEQEALLV